MHRFPDTLEARAAVATVRVMLLSTTAAVRSSLSEGQVERRRAMLNEPVTFLDDLALRRAPAPINSDTYPLAA